VKTVINRILIRVGWTLAAFAAAIVCFAAAIYFTFDPNVYFQRAVYLEHQFALYLHISGALLALITLGIQASPSVRRKWRRVHRWSGRAYVMGALSGGAGGLLLAPTAFSGPLASVGFVGLAVLTIVTTTIGFAAIRRGDLDEHRRWMIRSGSLIFAAVTLRLMLGATAGLQALGVPLEFETAYAAIAWLSWVPNLTIAVWVTRRRDSSMAGATATSPQGTGSRRRLQLR
jgi:uncharacterized membrane protein